MQEDFLHHVWRFQKISHSPLLTVQGEPLQILHPGDYLQQAGPDFFNAQIVLGNQKWAGNIELHLKSSDWYLHRHEIDSAYNNVILHVVWEHDVEVFRADNTEIPVLEIKSRVSKETLENYEALVASKSWIFCENSIATVDEFVLSHWKERLFFERLERKALPIKEQLIEKKFDWEAVFFAFLFKNFGLNLNGQAFFQIANTLPFAVIRKEKNDVENLEALFLGRAGLLDGDFQDVYFRELKSRWLYLSVKHKLEKVFMSPVQYFQLRPDNFPTIRLAQLAELYHSKEQLFSRVMECKTIEQLYSVFGVAPSEYWKSHYQFDNKSPQKVKRISKSFVNLLIVNTVIPMRLVYAQSQNLLVHEELISLLTTIDYEKNSIIDKFRSFGLQFENAFDSQSFLQLKNEYCDHKRCMSCAIGITLLKN